MGAHDLILKSHKLPPLYSTDGEGDAAWARIKWFDPCGSFTWYVLEYDPTDDLVFAFVTSSQCPEGELGYVSVEEIRKVRNRMGLRIERDLYWIPRTLGEIQAQRGCLASTG